MLKFTARRFPRRRLLKLSGNYSVTNIRVEFFPPFNRIRLLNGLSITDLEVNEEFVRSLLNSVGQLCPVPELVEQVGLFRKSRSRICLR
jgi:hypothetical protein